MTDKIREEFEEWAKTQDWTIDLLYREGYIAWEAQFAFDAWLASRAAIEIELPSPMPEAGQAWCADAQHAASARTSSFNWALSQSKRAIKAAGLKVKP